MGYAAARWEEALKRWAIPQEILDVAPESPWGCPVDLFKRRAGEPPPETPSRARAREALPVGGTVIDVGCGAGAAAHALVPPAGRVVGVDEDPAMLEAFAEAAAVAHAEVLGRWPDVEASVETGDVVVCHHVLYNVWDADHFVRALGAHARRRVVVELYEAHPLRWMNPLWRALHGVERPEEPRARDALELIRDTGADARMELWEAPARWDAALADSHFAFLRRLLCLPPERDEELRAALETAPPPAFRQAATIWWDAGGGAE